MTFWEDEPTSGAHELIAVISSTITYSSTKTYAGTRTTSADVVSVTQLSQAAPGAANSLAELYHVMCRNFSGGKKNCLLLLRNKIYHLKLEDVWAYANMTKSIK